MDTFRVVDIVAIVVITTIRFSLFFGTNPLRTIESNNQTTNKKDDDNTTTDPRTITIAFEAIAVVPSKVPLTAHTAEGALRARLA